MTAVPENMSAATAMLCVGPRSWDRSADNPHFPKRFHVYVNERGKAVMAGPLKSRFPEGSVVVKEKYDAATRANAAAKLPARPELLTIMVKGRRGSKPRTGDWSYYVADPSFKRVDGSQEARCASCHASQTKSDFTFRSYGDGNRALERASPRRGRIIEP